MKEALVQFLATLPPELAVIVLSALPITELRAGIPVGIAVFHLTPLSALLFGILGNLIPVLLIYILLPSIIRWAAKHSPTVDRLLKNYFDSLKTKHHETIEKYGSIGLAIFVAIPIPGTGTWTASVLAILFGIRPQYGIPAIAIGAILAGIAILLVTLGVVKLW